MLIQLFYLKFGLEQTGSTHKELMELEHEIQTNINAISSLDEDYIIRYFWSLIRTTLRTNYFQQTNDQLKDYLSFKLNTSKVPDLPPGQPMYEIFVYSTRFEGIHLRSAKVSRGGIRWSERTESKKFGDCTFWCQRWVYSKKNRDYI